MADAPHIRIAGLDVRYRTRDGWVSALEGIDLDVAPRSVVSVVGPSGCGKTTLLKVVSGILRPSAGRVLLDEGPLDPVKMAGQFGFVFQRPLLLPWRTALDNVALTAEIVQKERPRGERLAEARRRAQAEKGILSGRRRQRYCRHPHRGMGAERPAPRRDFP